MSDPFLPPEPENPFRKAEEETQKTPSQSIYPSHSTPSLFKSASPPDSSQQGSKKPETGSRKGNQNTPRQNLVFLTLTLLALIVSVIALVVVITDEDGTETVIREVQNVPSNIQDPTAVANGDVNSDGSVVSATTIPFEPARIGTAEFAAKKVTVTTVRVETEGGFGSGFFYDSSGLIMTAAHVVTGPDGEFYENVIIGISDGERIVHRVTGTVLGGDTRKDIAVVQVTPDETFNFGVAELALSQAVSPGQDVIAVGSPFGLENTVTKGIISAVNRTVLSSTGEVLGFNLIQTDTPINSGNSGGALADLNGNIVGINILIETGSTGASGNIGIGFAVPIAQAIGVANEVVEGKANQELGYLGITGRSSTIGPAGALVVDVVGGESASRAGIQEGDLIIEVDGNSITTYVELLTAIQLHEPNDEVELVILREIEDGTTGNTRLERLTLNLILGSRPT